MTNKKPAVTKTAKADTAKQAPAAPVPAASTPTQPALPPAPEGFFNVFVDGELLHVKKGSTVMQACTQAQKEIPHFCYHERLSIAGNCRMCLVEVEGMPKPIASCHWPIAEGMKIKTDSPMTINARKGTMELLLINHPLDCPICDQGGECTLQDLSVGYGSDRSAFHEFKRAVDDKDIGSKIKTVMTRCIHCTRCIRFATEIAGVEEMGATFRGENMQVGTYVEQAIQSELSGNMIDLCPVGALTSKPYAYTARPWELVRTNSIDILDAIGTPITVDNRHGQVLRTQPQENNAINEEWMTDAARFSYDALSTNRLTSPMIRRGKELQPCSWPEAFSVTKTALEKTSAAPAASSRVGAIIGSMASAEDALSFKMFMDTVLKGSAYDCRPAGSHLDQFYTFNTPLVEFESVDAVLLIGTNPRLEAPLLNVRLRRAALKRRVPVAAIGADMDLTYPSQDLGNDPASLESFGKSKFADVLKNAQKPAIILSASVLTRADGAAILAQVEKIAKKVGVVKDGWNGLNVLASTAGRITALDMQAKSAAPKSDTASILKSFNTGKTETLIVYGEDTILPEDFEGQGTLVYIGTHMTAIAAKADVILPAAAWSEKSGLYANAEGRVQLAHAAVQPPLNAKEDWKIFRALSEDMGNALPFNTLSQLRSLIAAQHPAYKGENWNKITPRNTMVGASDVEISSRPFQPVVTDYYLRLEYLRQSPTMHKCQSEVAAAALGTTGTPPTPLAPVKAKKPTNKAA